MSLNSAHYVVAEDEAEAFWFLGNLATVIASGEQTGGALSLVEFLAPAGFATPRHVHHSEDEAFYVLEKITRRYLRRHEVGSGRRIVRVAAEGSPPWV